MVTNTEHKKGKVDPAKVVRNWRILKSVDHNLHLEAAKKGFNSVPAFLNNLLTRYFNGETINRDP